MVEAKDCVDFTGLFKMDTLSKKKVYCHCFCEVGLKKLVAAASDEELIFVYIDAEMKSHTINYFWDTIDNPVYCMCFDPSGTWLAVMSEDKLLLVPFLVLFIQDHTYDQKWSLDRVTVLPIHDLQRPTNIIWWLTNESDNILICAPQDSILQFYSLETQTVVADTKLTKPAASLQLCYDNSLDVITILMWEGKEKYTKLSLEHRSFRYNWLHTVTRQTEIKDGFVSFFKDRINVFARGSRAIRPLAMEHSLEAEDFNSRSSKEGWYMVSQYVNGRHYVTAFEGELGFVYLESFDDYKPLKHNIPSLKTEEGIKYRMALWSQKILYVLRNNYLEIHSTPLSHVTSKGEPKAPCTIIGDVELIGNLLDAYLITIRDPPNPKPGWKEPTFLCDLQMPRFNLPPLLIVTSAGVFLFTTKLDPAEWLVTQIMNAKSHMDMCCAALGVSKQEYMRAAADMMLSRGKLESAQYLYSLSQLPDDGWLARLGVYGHLSELISYKNQSRDNVEVTPLGKSGITVKLMAILHKIATQHVEVMETDAKFPILGEKEFEDLTALTACLGLWNLVPTFNLKHGYPKIMLFAMEYMGELCRGAFDCLLRHKFVVPTLLDPCCPDWFLEYIGTNCKKFDIKLLKTLCVWLCPLQEQLRPALRDVKDGFSHATKDKMTKLIHAFMQVASEIDSRDPSRQISLDLPQTNDTWKSQYDPKRSLSCGWTHWAICDEGNAKIFGADTPISIEQIGRVINVSCGRHHTLVLTENGVYASGDNTYGQLGVGSAWAGAIGDRASATGTLLYIDHDWNALVTVAAGHYHSAAIDKGGRLYMWGWGVHGQLGLGNIDDKWSPQLVTGLQGRKIISVGCGACHTVALTMNGEVYSFGASVFGQLGSGSRTKCTVPLRVNTGVTIEKISVGYFHTLALTSTDKVLIWGGSPQLVRAANARRGQPGTPIPDGDVSGDHLSPQNVSLEDVSGRVVQIAAGCHHSCIVTNKGILYTWGLNFDGQLGSGDRKHVVSPKKAEFQLDIPKDTRQSSSPSPEENADSSSSSSEGDDMETKALVACSIDLTVFIDDDGRVWAAGNTHLEANKETPKTSSRVIMMKTTKRVIKIPATNHSNSKYRFLPIDRVDIMFPFCTDIPTRSPIQTIYNPLKSVDDFQKKSWSDEVVMSLLPVLTDEFYDNFKANGHSNMLAKLAFHKKKYSDCLKMLLESLKVEQKEDILYCAHANVCKETKDAEVSEALTKRIKNISLSILNNEEYPDIDPTVYQLLNCSCNEASYLPKDELQFIAPKPDISLSKQAASIVDMCMGMFPVEADLWESCFRIAKDFYLENNLCAEDLEAILQKYMEIDPAKMASAVMYSSDCVQYNKILSPKFYLSMCSNAMNSWS